MAGTSQISVRIDTDVKESAQEVLEDIGLSMSAAITVFLKRVSRERRIPFELSADPFYAPENIAYLEGLRRDADAGRSHYAEHDLVEA